MSTTRVEPYKQASKSARALSEHIGVLRATSKQVNKHGTFDTIINWGNSERRFENAEYINNPEAVAIASNKLFTARRFGEAYINQPEYTTDKAVALGWLDQKNDVLCRTLLRASGGGGITLVTPGGDAAGDGSSTGSSKDAAEGLHSNHSSSGPAGDGRDDRYARGHDRGRGRGVVRRGGVLVDAPLYTKYVKKAVEYRVHVFDGVVIDVQEKRKRQEVPNDDIDYQIRNTDTGWVFCRDGVDCPDVVKSTAIRAVSVLGLDFGAVDVGYNRRNEAEVVYEVNTAPGLEGTTLEKYREAIQGRLPYISRGVYQRRRAG